MLHDSELPAEFWEFAADFVVFLHNRTWSPRLGKTLYEEWFNKKPDMSNVKVFGCIAFVYNSTEPSTQHKLLPRAWKGIYVGCGGSGMKIWDLINKRLVISNHVKVEENSKGADWLKELAREGMPQITRPA